MTSSANNNSDNVVVSETYHAQNLSLERQFEHTKIGGRFNQYTSGYWALALPALAARYVGRYFGNIFNLESKPGFKRFYPVAVGSWMAGITALYASRTYDDMRKVFAETVGFEFDKKPEDVTFRDFFNSKNAIIHRTMRNFIKYNTRRAIVSSSFFAFLLPWKPFKQLQADSVDLGVGVAGGYLVSDVLGRKITFFEALQQFIDTKINHTESVGLTISSSDLMNLYAIHSRDNDPERFKASKMDTIGWNNDQIIFGRMSDLMNQTYGNTVNKDKANFTVPKLIYLLGNGLLRRGNIEQSLGYIEVANRYGMEAVKEMAKSVENGMDFKQAIRPFPVTLPSRQPELKKSEKLAAGYVDRLNELQRNETLPDVRSL